MTDLLQTARTIIDAIDQCETTGEITELAWRHQAEVDAIKKATDPLTSVRATHIRNAARLKRAELEGKL